MAARRDPATLDPVFRALADPSRRQLLESLRARPDPASTSRYWGCSFDSDWREGSTYPLEQKGLRVAHPDQRVLVSDPPRRLAYTWHTFSPEWGEVVGREVGISPEDVARMAAEPRSKV